jgi:hypothetical protein
MNFLLYNLNGITNESISLNKEWKISNISLENVKQYNSQNDL